MKPTIHGHRGARGQRPENTLAAIEYALQHAADGVEVDVCATQDDEIVVHHDLQLNPNTTRDAKGEWITQRIPIRELSLAALAQYDVGRMRPGSDYAKKFPEQVAMDGARIPTLDECIELLLANDNPVILNLEMKRDPRQPELTPEPDHYAALVLAKLEAFRLPQQVFLQSFDWELMTLLKKELATRKLDFKTGFTIRRPYGSADLHAVKNKGGDVFSCNHRGLTEPLVGAAHDLGLEVYAWTVNEAPAIERMAEWGVDVIITDYPERCRALLHAL